ncbi:MAG TPA: amidohydrolase [Bryobacteraceae bacterium]|jgi:5-methylthioadenosine/S-adenosylhomocysteine deaminase|nr:amidohydrolase [Bryobacteraceae bacterium]
MHRSSNNRTARLSLFLLIAAVAARGAPADWIWSARYVVTMDAQRRVIENGAVAIVGDHIAAVGPRAEIDRAWQAKQRLDRPNAILAPGLINAHTHVPMSLFRGMADDLDLQDWLEHYIFPAEAKNVDADFVRWGARLSCLEMALSGTTAFVDMYYFEDSIAAVAKEAGMRGILGETIIGFPAPDYKTSSESLAATERFFREFSNDALIIPAVAPHAIYTNSEDTLKRSRALAGRYHRPLVIHLAETKKENEDALAKYKMTAAAALDSMGVFHGWTIAAHGVWLNDADLKILKARGVGLAHNPSSNMKLASGIAPVAKILGQGIAMGLGTDGAASNNDQDLMREIDLAAKLQKVAAGDPRALPAEEAFAMATITGARAIGLEKMIGSIEPSKRADLIEISLGAPHASPLYNVYSQLVYSLQGSDVSDVMVNGRAIVRDRKMLTLDEAAVLAKAAEYREKIRKSLRR